MKKILALITVLVLTAALIVPAAAAEYSFDEYGMSVNIPDGWLSVTRDTSPDHEIFTLLGYDPTEFFTYMSGNGILINAFSGDFTAEMTVVVTESEESADVFNYNRFTDGEMAEGSEDLLEEMKKLVENFTPVEGTFHNVGNVKYAVLDYYRITDTATIYSRQYYTVYNGLSVSVSVHSVDEPLSEQDKADLLIAADSLVFAETLEIPEEPLFDWGEIFKDTVIGAGIGVAITLVWSVIARANQKRKDKKAAEKRAAEESEE